MAPLLGIVTKGEFMPVVIEALFIKLVFIIVIVPCADAVA